MKDTQRISEYLVKFNSLAVRCSWGEPALRFRFYDGLPARLKDEISKGEGKPRTLTELRERAKNIDARYWERQAERSREQHQGQKQSKQTTTTSTATTSTSTPSTSSKTPSRTTDQKTPKNKDAKPTTPRADLTGKLDTHGKLTDKESQNRIDKNLCMYCGKPGHRTADCNLAKAAKGRAAAASSDTTPAKPKDSGSEKKKD